MTIANKLEEKRRRYEELKRGKNKYTFKDDGIKRTHDKMFLLDVSLSMSGNKLQNAKIALDKYIKAGDGLIVFGEEAHYIPEGQLNTIQPYGLTAMLPAIVLSMKYNAVELIIITDGDPNQGGNTMNVLDYVSGLTGIKIDTIGIGDDCDISFLETLSEGTGGKSIHVDSPEYLDGAIALLCAPSIQLTEG